VFFFRTGLITGVIYQKFDILTFGAETGGRPGATGERSALPELRAHKGTRQPIRIGGNHGSGH
jgi:hypothetical protein